ncbi:phosphoenolpyruvate-utilizing N-terminal domain-containing protein, partial [Rhodococcus chondri]
MNKAAHVLHGTPVVPGVGYGPVIRPTPRCEIVTSSATTIPDTAREAEVGRFEAAAAAVADRLRARAT